MGNQRITELKIWKVRKLNVKSELINFFTLTVTKN